MPIRRLRARRGVAHINSPVDLQLAKGEPNRKEIVVTVIADKVREMI